MNVVLSLIFQVHASYCVTGNGVALEGVGVARGAIMRLLMERKPVGSSGIYKPVALYAGVRK